MFTYERLLENVRAIQGSDAYANADVVNFVMFSGQYGSATNERILRLKGQLTDAQRSIQSTRARIRWYWVYDMVKSRHIKARAQERDKALFFAEYAHWHKQSHITEAELRQLRSEFQSLSTQFTDLSGELARNKAEQVSVQAALATSQTTVETTSASLVALEDRLSTTQIALEAKDSTVRQLAQRNVNLESSARTLELLTFHNWDATNWVSFSVGCLAGYEACAAPLNGVPLKYRPVAWTLNRLRNCCKTGGGGASAPVKARVPDALRPSSPVQATDAYIAVPSHQPMPAVPVSVHVPS